MPEELGLTLVAGVWLLLWTPAVAAGMLAAPRARDFVRRRKAKRLAKVVYAAIWSVILLAYIPIFVFLFLSFLDLFIATFSSE